METKGKAPGQMQTVNQLKAADIEKGNLPAGQGLMKGTDMQAVTAGMQQTGIQRETQTSWTGIDIAAAGI